MTAQATRATAERGHITHSEIEWLRSFGWNVERIAARLGVTVACVEAHLSGRRGTS